ncbi:MAG: C40 family peptidase, partial [Bacteroidetes bacterium]|nr:C40 family peptidase [Bacteroidota bacterium]
GICLLNIVPLRKEASDRSEMISQVLFGERFQILDKNSKWSLIRLTDDLYEGWIDNKQFEPITAKLYNQIEKLYPIYSAEFIDFIKLKNSQLAVLSMGANLPLFGEGILNVNQHQFEYDGATFKGKLPKSNVINIALMYLNTPYLWGGKSPFGIDCSGLTQMVYKICGYLLPRDAYQQAMQGATLNFLEECEPGDLAFFDNEAGSIIHVGILMGNDQIIHASGKVRIDLIDHSGIFNQETKQHTHKLRLLKRIIN